MRGSTQLAALALVLGFATGLALAAAPQKGFPDAPKFVKPVSEEPAPGTRADVVADRLTYNDRTKIAVATGMVRVTYGPYTLVATKVVYNLSDGSFKADGRVEFREPNGNILQADMAALSDKFKEGFARHVRALLTNDVTITADYARRTGGNITVYENARYTACRTCVDAGHNPIWQIVARTATHDQNKKTIYYDNPYFEFAGVPVAWLPYLAYPDPTVKRRSGFLLPDFSSDGDYGFGVTTPYFWALAPNADLTFRPKWTTKQGPVGDVEWRHRLKDGIYSIRGYGLYQSDGDTNDNSGKWRGAVTTHGEFDINDVWSWGWNGALMTDKTFLRDYDYKYGDSDIATSEVHVTALEDRTYISAQALHYQTMLLTEDQDKMPTVLPYIVANHTFGKPVLGGELGFNVSAYSLTRDDPSLDPTLDLSAEQTRVVTDLHWQKQMINGLGQVITPFAQVRGDVYVSEDVTDAPDSQETTGHLLPTAGVDMRWPFLSTGASSQSVLTPVLQVISSANEQDEADIADEDAITLNFDHTNLFLQDRFTGLDRYEGGTRANAGVTYSVLGGNGGFARASFGESFHIAGENSFTEGSGLDGPKSDLVGALALQPSEDFRLTYQVRAEEDLSAINSQEASIGLTLDRFAGSVSFADVVAAPDYGRPDDETQLWGDASYAFTDSWSVFGGFRYDLRTDDFRDKTVGLMYYCDCLRATLSYTERDGEEALVDDVDRTIKLSVEFRTIGEIGGGFGL